MLPLASRWEPVANMKILETLLGKRLDPFRGETKQHMALVAFLAWVGLGADGLSSSCYGPEEAFLALGRHTHLGLYMALATAITVFVIAIAYNQVIELFPSGGGGYKVATSLIGPHAGLVSGSALIVDYMLTIAISTPLAGAVHLCRRGPLDVQLHVAELLLGIDVTGIVNHLRIAVFHLPGRGHRLAIALLAAV